jgi:hypothetical protein
MSPVINFAISDLDVEPDKIGPRLRPCTFDDHEWRLMIEDGRAYLECLNACSEHRKSWMAYEPHGPMCDMIPDWHDSMTMSDIPVTVKIVTEYYSGEFGGQGDCDAWLEVTPVLDSK